MNELRLTIVGNLTDDPELRFTESLKRGTRVLASGTLKQRSYDDKDGVKRTVIEMTVDEIGPSLRYATAAVTKKGGTGGGSKSNRGDAEWEGASKTRPAASQPARSASAAPAATAAPAAADPFDNL